MQTYCVSCRKTQNKDAKVAKTKNGRLQIRPHVQFVEIQK